MLNKQTNSFDARSSNSTIVLLGGAGYIGPVIADHLLDQGYKIVIYDNLVYKHYQSTSALFLNENFSFVFGDLSDTAKVAETCSGAEAVVILGGLVGDPITKRYPEQSALVNDKAIFDTIDCLDGANVSRVVFVSTCSNYGLMPEGQIAHEDSELNPLSLYAKSKVNAEKHLLGKKGDVSYSATILRFATAFGLAPRMRFDLTVNEFTRDVFLQKDLLVYDADTWRPYCHVKDFARLIATTLSADADLVNFEIFNAGGDVNNRTKRNLIDDIGQYLPIDRVSYKEGGVDPRNYRVDFTKVRDTLGFEPQFDIYYGIREIIAAMQSNVFAGVDENRNYYGNYEI